MLNKLFQIAFIQLSSPFLDFLVSNVYIMLILTPIAFIINLITLNKLKKHPRKKLKIYNISFILSLIVNFVTASLLIITGPIVLLFLLLITGYYIYLYFKKKKKKQILFQIISIIIPITYLFILYIIITNY